MQAKEKVLGRIRQIPHYRDVDYDGLATRYGEEWLLRRLERQLLLYERHHFHPHSLHRLFSRFGFRTCVRAGLFLMGQLGAARALARRPVLTEREILLPGLPEAFEGFRLLHLSDFHFENHLGLADIVLEQVAPLSFDACVLTGDYRGEVYGPYLDAMRDLERARPVLGSDVFAVLGNHDSIEMSAGFAAMDIRFLNNESIWLERGGARILLAGIDDAHFYRTEDFTPLRPRVAESPCSILLSHSPEPYREAEAAGFDLMLSGHTHGGQICLPGGVPVVAHVRDTPKEMIKGPWRWKSLQGYTSRGIGASGVDCRWHCPPEITVHVLRRAVRPAPPAG